MQSVQWCFWLAPIYIEFFIFLVTVGSFLLYKFKVWSLLMKTREQKPTNYCSFLSQDTKEAVVREFKVTTDGYWQNAEMFLKQDFRFPFRKKNNRQFTSRALATTFLRQLDLGWRGCFAQNCLGRSRKSLYSAGRRRYFSPQAQCIVGRQKWNWRYAGWTILIVCDIPEFSLLLLEPSPKHAVHSFPKHILTMFLNWINVNTEWNALTVR